MGDLRLKTFANKSAGRLKVFNGLILFGLATVLNYGSIQLNSDSSMKTSSPNQIETSSISTPNSDDKPVVPTISKSESETIIANAPKNENLHQDLIDACEKGKGHLCFELGNLYKMDGDTDNAKKYMKKACDAGFQNGCDGL